MTAPPSRLCARASCSKPVRKREKEPLGDFKRRKFCCAECARRCKPWSMNSEKRRDVS